MSGRINISYLFRQACDKDINHDNRSNSFLSDFLDYDFEVHDQFDDIYLNDAEDSVQAGNVDKLTNSVIPVGTVSSLLDLSAKVVGKYKTCQELEQYQPPLDEPLLKKVAYWAFPVSEKCVEPVAALWYKRKARTCGDGRKVHEEWEAGRKLVRNNSITKMWQVGFMATAVIKKPTVSLPKPNMIYNTNSSVDSDDTDSMEQLSPNQKPEPEEDECTKVCLTFEKQQITSSLCSQCDGGSGWCEHVVAAVLYHIQNPKQVQQYAPITDVLAALSRDQLQKLLQYILLEDKVNVLHSVVKYLDDIRDVTSVLNETPGAPDPTFGLDESVPTTMDISMKSYQDNLYDTLDHAEEPSAKYYLDGFDWSCKVNTDFNDFVSKVLQLQQGGHYSAAAQLFQAILKELVGNIDGYCEGNYVAPQDASIAMTIHDLSRMLSLCIISPHNKKCIDLEEIFATIEQLASKIPDHVGAISFNSDWAELPHAVLGIAGLHEDHALSEEGINLKCKLLGDILTTKYIPPWPEELHDLLEGQVQWKQSQYNENIVLMLTRIECLMQLSDDTNCDHVLKLLPIALRKLTMLAQKFSLLGGCVDIWQDVFDLGHSIPALRESKYQKCKNLVKRRKLTHNHFEPELTQSQVTYALLFCLHLKKVCEDASGKVFEGPLTTAPFCFLALELSRSRLYDDSLDPTEQSWLDKLENIVSKQIECLYGISQPRPLRSGTLVVEDNNMIMWYLDALRLDGDTYYRHQVPMQLLKILFYLINKKQLQNTLSEKIVVICAAIILRIKTAVDDSATVCTRMKDFDMVGDLVEMFFECLDVKIFAHLDLLIQVMQNLTGICLKYENFQRRAFTAFYDKRIDMECHPMFLKTSFKFALNSISSGATTSSATMYDRWRDHVFDHIKKCIRNIGLPALQDVLDCQLRSLSKNVSSIEKKPFSMVELSEVLSLLKPQITMCDTMPENVHYVIKKCVAEPEDIYHLPELLALFRSDNTGCQYFKECVDTVLGEYKKLSSNRLFSIAKLYEEKRKEQSLLQSQNICCDSIQPQVLDLSNKLPDNFHPISGSHQLFDDYLMPSNFCLIGSASGPLEVTNQEEISEYASQRAGPSTSVTPNTHNHHQVLDLSYKPTEDKVMEIIEKAFEQLNHEHKTEDHCFHSCQEGHVKWAYEYCTVDDVIWSDKFVHLIEIIKNHGRAHPMLVLMLFDVVDKNLIGVTHLNTLKLALIEAYKDFHIMNARHVRSPGYNRVINNVRRDRDKFLDLFGIECSKEYDTSVVEGIKTEYRTRRRLVRLLDEAFLHDL